VFPLKNKEKLKHGSSLASNKSVDDVQELRRSKRDRKERNFSNVLLLILLMMIEPIMTKQLNLFDAFVSVRSYK
jgi:hypothetical protein